MSGIDDQPELSPQRDDSHHLPSRFIRLEDGQLTEDQLMDISQELLDSPTKRGMLIDLQIRSLLIRNLLKSRPNMLPCSDVTATLTTSLAEVTVENNGSKATPNTRSPYGLLTDAASPVWRPVAFGVAAAAMTLVASLGLMLWNRWSTHDRGVQVPGITLTGMSYAQFVGASQPTLNAAMQLNVDYKLLGGMVELSFPSGTSAIIEGPALFRISSPEVFVLNIGTCSIHVPDPSSRFVVETPMNLIVDQGTRFTVKVDDSMSTTVQVVDGVANLLRKSSTGSIASQSSPATKLRLVSRTAVRVSEQGSLFEESIPFTEGAYRDRLPDRVVSFETTMGGQGGAEMLRTLTISSHGQARTYRADELIPCRVQWFKASIISENGHIISPPDMQLDLADVLGDMRLNSGLANPGGSSRPLEVPPQLHSASEGTPGLAVRFQRPLVNRPGIDLALFELQTITNPIRGDSFHVSPVRFGEHSCSHTVSSYDIQFDSLQSPRLEPFALRRFETLIQSLEDLDGPSILRPELRQGFQILAVGIDLSDLGYAIGEEVLELFFQDTEDDVHYFDPVLIVGFP